MKCVRTLGMDRIEIRFPFGSGIYLCDEERWNQKHQSTLKRYYVSLFWKHKKRIAFELSKLPLFHLLWRKK